MKFFHYIPKSKRGGVTIAHELIEHRQGKTVIFAFAQVSDKDAYCKKIGRDIALNNYIKGNTIKLVVKGSKKNIQSRVEKELWALAHTVYKVQAQHGN